MPRQWLSEKLPTNKQLQVQLGWDSASDEEIERSAWLVWVNKKLADPLLWSLNRRSVAGAVAVGLFVAWLPVPMQMLIAAILAAVLRVHVPVSVVMVWFSNPLTFPPLLYAAWFVGSTILGTQMVASPLSMNVTELMKATADAWPVILFGSLFCATLFGVIGFFATNLIWRVVAIRRWRKREQRSNIPKSRS